MEEEDNYQKAFEEHRKIQDLVDTHRQKVETLLDTIAEVIPIEYKIQMMSLMAKGKMLNRQLCRTLVDVYMDLRELQELCTMETPEEEPDAFIERVLIKSLSDVRDRIDSLNEYNDIAKQIFAVISDPEFVDALEKRRAQKLQAKYKTAKEIYEILRDAVQTIDVKALKFIVAITDAVIKAAEMMNKKAAHRDIADFLEKQLNLVVESFNEQVSQNSQLDDTLNELAMDLKQLIRAPKRPKERLVRITNRIIEGIIQMNHNFYLGINFKKIEAYINENK